MNIVCILAGGEGSRLWPLSTPLKPKQIIKLNNENSLIQNTYNLLKKITTEIFIISEKTHSAEMLEQLKNFDKKRMIIEPCRKGTTNCTLLAARHIRNFYKGKEDNSKILFIHADHIFDNDNNFTNSIKKAFAINNKGAIVIGGKKPTSAQTKYGYVKIEKNSPYIYKVLEFKEKPTLEVAKKLCKDGNYYWNEGFFIVSIIDLVSNFKKVSNAIYNNINILFSLKDKEVEKFYSKLQTESIEKSLMEKSKNVLLSPISFSWVDLGTYNSLCNILKSDNTNVIKGKNIYELENKNTFIHNTTNIKVGVIGLENVAVVLTNGGLLVLNKDKENLVSEISKRMK